MLKEYSLLFQDGSEDFENGMEGNVILMLKVSLPRICTEMWFLKKWERERNGMSEIGHC